MRDGGRKRESTPRRYPRPRDVEGAITAARANGLVVRAVEVTRDGAIRISDSSSAPDETLFDTWDKAQRL